MTKREAVKLFKASVTFPLNKDKAYTRMVWNNFTDSLHRNGQITAKQYDTWDNPFN